MALLTGEAAPLAPLLIPLGELLVWAVALAVCLAVVYFAKAFFGITGSILGKLPVVGGWVDSGLRSVEQKIVSTMSAAASTCDAKVGAAFHQLARVVDWLGHEIAAHANLINTLATVLFGTNVAWDIQQALRGIRALVRGIEASAHDALRRVHTIERALIRPLTADVFPRLRAIDRELGHVIHWDIPSLRARDRALEDGALNTWKWIRSHPLSATSAAFAGAVAIAIARLGMGWARCSNWNKIGREVCATNPAEIDALLGLVISAIAIADYQDLVRSMQQVEKVTAEAVQELLRV